MINLLVSRLIDVSVGASMFNVKHPVVHFRPASHVVADFGCGDCKIALSVKNKVHSFDLAPISDLVTVCDMAHVSVFPHICDSAGRPLPWGLICWIVDARSDVLKTDLAFPPHFPFTGTS